MCARLRFTSRHLGINGTDRMRGFWGYYYYFFFFNRKGLSVIASSKLCLVASRMPFLELLTYAWFIRPA